MFNFLKKKKDALLEKEEELKTKGYQERHIVYFANGHILRMYTKMLEDKSLINYVDMNGNPVSIPGYANLVCYHIVEQLQGNSLEVLHEKINPTEEKIPTSPVEKLKELKTKLKGIK